MEYRLEVRITTSLNFGEFKSSCCVILFYISLKNISVFHFSLVALISSACVMITHLFMNPDVLAVGMLAGPNS